MLETISIRGLATIDQTRLEFEKGLNILSGETGAGKSIILDAISLLLGERASADLIRKGCDQALVEGLFQIKNLPWVKRRLSDQGIESRDGELHIRRIISAAGKNRVLINEQVATVPALASITEGLIDLCSQHEHQILLKPRYQLELIDRYTGLTEQAHSVSEMYSVWKKIQTEIASLEMNERERTQKLDFLKYQYQELEQAELKENEEVELQVRKKELQSSQQFQELIQTALSTLEGDAGILEQLGKLQRSLEKLEVPASAVTEFEAQSADLAMELNRKLERLEASPGELDSILERLSLILNLKRKHGPEVSDVLRAGENLKAEIDKLESLSEHREKLEAEKTELEKKIFAEAKKLSKKRQNAAITLSESVIKELKDLNLKGAKLRMLVEFIPNLNEWTLGQGDKIEFRVQTNPGEAEKPLSKIASGGELSRLMLALRRVISDKGGIGVYLFDEIDTGMSGQTAFQVGQKLKSVATYNQVICITHLPQVAAFADHHLSVRKKVTQGRTETDVEILTATERKKELARMLGGPELTKKSLENAAELMEIARR